MKQELKDLAKHRLERAKNTLLDAQKYFKNATLSSTVNRIYYAMFYAVNGLLIAKGLSSSKHSGVRALFNKEFIEITFTIMSYNFCKSTSRDSTVD